jgi:hypothetical protein
MITSGDGEGGGVEVKREVKVGRLGRASERDVRDEGIQ